MLGLIAGPEDTPTFDTREIIVIEEAHFNSVYEQKDQRLQIELCDPHCSEEIRLWRTEAAASDSQLCVRAPAAVLLSVSRSQFATVLDCNSRTAPKPNVNCSKPKPTIRSMYLYGLLNHNLNLPKYHLRPQLMPHLILSFKDSQLSN